MKQMDRMTMNGLADSHTSTKHHPPRLSHEAYNLAELHDMTISCEMCPELVKCRSRVVPGYGDPHPNVLFIGEAPGRLGADVTGVPFTKDRSGQLFLKMLGSIGLTASLPEDHAPLLHKAFVTNIVKCNPKTVEGANRAPKNDEIANCSYFLKEEIRLLSPKIIVPLGVMAAKQILGEEFDSNSFGRPDLRANILYFPLWHPAFIVRGGGKSKMNERKYRKEFRKLMKLIQNVDPDFSPIFANGRRRKSR